MLPARKTEHQVLDGLIAEWAESIVQDCHKSDFYGINVVERILRDPGRSTKGSQHRVLWWPRNKRVARIGRAMHRIDPVSQVCLIVGYGSIRDDNGVVFDKYSLSKHSSLGVREINKKIKEAKNKLLAVLKA